MRPNSFSDFVGQQRIVNEIKILTSGAVSKKIRFPHTLFKGPPGLGKTTLALLIIQTLGCSFKIVQGASLQTVADVLNVFSNLQTDEIIFIDEIHSINKVAAELIYSALEDGVIDINIGKDFNSRSIRINLNNFTLIGATTNANLIRKSLLDRFVLSYELEPYSISEIETLIEKVSSSWNIPLSHQDFLRIKKRCRLNPRIAISILIRIKNLLESGEITIQEALNQIDPDLSDLENIEIRYLQTLKDAASTLSLRALAANLNLSEEIILHSVEPFLLKQNYIETHVRGRVITQKGLQALELTS